LGIELLMANRKSKLDKATDIVTKIIQKQINTLPSAAATAKRKRLHTLAAKLSDRVKRNQRCPV
jgi:hypothetical protein